MKNAEVEIKGEEVEPPSITSRMENCIIPKLWNSAADPFEKPRASGISIRLTRPRTRKWTLRGYGTSVLI